MSDDTFTVARSEIVERSALGVMIEKELVAGGMHFLDAAKAADILCGLDKPARYVVVPNPDRHIGTLASEMAS